MGINKIQKRSVLFTSSNFPSGGPGATYLNLFCKGFQEINGDIKVYLYKGYIYKNNKVQRKKNNETDYRVKYINLGFSNRPDFKVIKILEDFLSIFKTTFLMLTLILKRKTTTIFVYSNDFLSNIPVYIIAKLAGIKLISFVPEYYDKKESKKMGIISMIRWNLFYLNYSLLNKLSNKLIVFSHFLKNDYINNGYDTKNIIVQPNLTDLNDWYLPNQAIKFTIGYAGTPSKKDGILDLIFSIKLLKDKGYLINVIIIGDSIGNESYLPELREYCKNLEISEQIIFKGLIPQKEVKIYLNCCQILAITRPNTKQTQAGFPTKLGEYMGCKKVVLATRFGDIERYFKDKTDIVFAEPDNPTSIAENIEWILNNIENSNDIAQKGFETANRILNYKKGVQKIIQSLNIEI